MRESHARSYKRRYHLERSSRCRFLFTDRSYPGEERTPGKRKVRIVERGFGLCRDRRRHEVVWRQAPAGL